MDDETPAGGAVGGLPPRGGTPGTRTRGETCGEPRDASMVPSAPDVRLSLRTCRATPCSGLCAKSPTSVADRATSLGLHDPHGEERGLGDLHGGWGRPSLARGSDLYTPPSSLTEALGGQRESLGPQGQGPSPCRAWGPLVPLKWGRAPGRVGGAGGPARQVGTSKRDRERGRREK